MGRSYSRHGNREENKNRRDLDVDARLLVERILEKTEEVVPTGFI
jgi:hypothetical protein